MESSARVPRCSAKNCSAAAIHAVVWNNPKLHPPEREKVWLGCDVHADGLRTFLAARGFFRYVENLGDRRTRGCES